VADELAEPEESVPPPPEQADVTPEVGGTDEEAVWVAAQGDHTDPVIREDERGTGPWHGGMVSRTRSGRSERDRRLIAVDAARTTRGRPTVSAVIVTYRRPEALATALARLRGLPVDEVIVVDNSADPETAAVVERAGSGARLVASPENLGQAGVNLVAREARGDLLLMIDDDAYPMPGAIERLVEAFRAAPGLGVAGGMVLDVDENGDVVRSSEIGTFDWFLRGGRTGDGPVEGLPAYFFPEGASMIRRQAYLEAGGFFAPFFLGRVLGLDLAARLLARGWDVRYVPGACFHHSKDPGGRVHTGAFLRRAIRNQVWYFWLRFPADVAARRIPAYLAFDLILSVYSRQPAAWFGGIADAWRDREHVRPHRDPLPRGLLPRIELNRGRMHVRLLLGQLRRRLAPLRPGR
jgi:GT2 family glycosyltransferase